MSAFFAGKMLRYHLIQRAKYGLSALEWRLEVGRVPEECSDRLSSDHAVRIIRSPQNSLFRFSQSDKSTWF